MLFIDRMTDSGNQKARMTWEQAVEWLRTQPGCEEEIKANYFDDPLSASAERFFNSAEWRATRSLFSSGFGEALDLGAGRGISSYAMARDGWAVTALEPDPSSLVGAGAICQLVKDSGLSIKVVTEYGERLPFSDGVFSLIYGRQVLHHARDLAMLCREVFRVLRKGGRFIAVREHVVDRESDLKAFLASHRLHGLYGGENAYTLQAYTSAIAKSGLRLRRVLGPFDSPVNYFPLSEEEWRAYCRAPLIRRFGERFARSATDDRHLIGRWMLRYLAAWRSKKDHSPGRLFSFMAEK